MLMAFCAQEARKYLFPSAVKLIDLTLPCRALRGSHTSFAGTRSPVFSSDIRAVPSSDLDAISLESGENATELVVFV